MNYCIIFTSGLQPGYNPFTTRLQPTCNPVTTYLQPTCKLVANNFQVGYKLLACWLQVECTLLASHIEIILDHSLMKMLSLFLIFIIWSDWVIILISVLIDLFIQLFPTGLPREPSGLPVGYLFQWKDTGMGYWATFYIRKSISLHFRPIWWRMQT